jgi:uncharacterized protein
MDLTAEQSIRAPRERVWAALNDPDVLKACIPGADEVVRNGDSEFAVGMTAAVGPVKAKFRAKLTLSDVVVPEGYTLTFDGQGGAAGFSKGTAKVALAADASGMTVMRYSVHAQIGGKLAQVGQRLIDAAARKVADDFFTRFKAQVEVVPAAAETASSAAGTSSASAPMPAAHIPGVVWVVAALMALMLGMGMLARL